MKIFITTYMLCIAVGVKATSSLNDFDNRDTLRTDTVDYFKSVDLNGVRKFNIELQSQVLV